MGPAARLPWPWEQRAASRVAHFRACTRNAMFPLPGTRGRAGAALLPALVCLLSGCGDGRIPVPAVSAEEAGKQAVAKYDKNGDGLLDAEELDRCPALKGSLKLIDKNGDGKLAAGEITDRIAALQATKIGLL